MKFFSRPPDFIIGEPEKPYMLRWWIIPRNRYFNIYLHKFLRSDDDRALHDHPWPSISLLLNGGYYEELPRNIFEWHEYGNRNTIKKLRKPFRPIFRGSHAIHRIELLRDWRMHDQWPLRPVWSLFITGPKVREWGFWCPKGWRNWRNFVGVPQGEAKGNEIGMGCDD